MKVAQTLPAGFSAVTLLSMLFFFSGCTGGAPAGTPAPSPTPVPHVNVETSVTIEKFVTAGQPLPPTATLFNDKEIALTFDDGPDPDVTPRVLATLKKFRVHAMFFEVGEFAGYYPELTKQVVAEGHALASHSWDHADLATLSLSDAIANVQHGQSSVETAAGASIHTPFFRFPFLSWTADLVTGIEALGFVVCDVNIDTFDYATPDPAVLLPAALAAVEAGGRGMVLFHDIQPQTADMLEAFLTTITERGYKTVVLRTSP